MGGQLPAQYAGISTDLFVYGLQGALSMALEHPAQPASYVVLAILSRHGVAEDPRAIQADTEIPPVQSALLLLALSDVATPQALSSGDRPEEEGLFSGERIFAMGMLIAGGLLPVTETATVAVAASELVVVAIVSGSGYGLYLLGSGLTDRGGLPLALSHATVALDPDTPAVVVVEAGVGGVRDLAPVATITRPHDGREYTQGAAVSLRGTGADPEEGGLGGASLVWSSDRDGTLGTGETITIVSLSAGTHTITLTAMDSKRLAGMASVGVTIAPRSQAPAA